MDSENSRSVTLLLLDGTPTGLIQAEIMNWNGRALAGPRSRIGEILKREESAGTGVYFLVGDDPDQPARKRIYIGEGDVVADRIKSHSTDESKEFWDQVCLVTAKGNLNKAHVRYLESRLIRIAKESGRSNLANGKDPSKKLLSEAEIAYMESFLRQTRLILQILGFDFLRPKIDGTPHSKQTIADGNEHSNAVELTLVGKKHGYAAKAIESDGEVTVLVGSTAMAGAGSAQDAYSSLREQLIKDGQLTLVSGGALLEFAENVTFKSPSAAASVINNHNTNGRKDWKLKSTGQTLKEWQDSQVG
jgi:hypothetical protein